MSDLFDNALSFEDEHIQKGQEDGIREGKIAGIREGRELGVQKGYEIGFEVGYYNGCVRSWRKLQEIAPDSIPARSDRGIAALEELLRSYPLYDPQDEKLHDVLESIRGKFKAVVTTLGHLGDYLPKEAGADSLSF